MSKYSAKITKQEFEKYMLLGQSAEVNIQTAKAINDNFFDYSKAHGNFFADNIYGKTHMPVHPLLEPFLGVFDVQSVIIPKWFDEFKSELTFWMCDMLEEHNPEVNEEISNYTDGATVTKATDKVIKLFKNLKAMTPANFDEGKLPDGTKIIKSIISTIEVGVGKKNLEPEKTEWYKKYVANKLEGGGKRMVITNNTVAKLGISSLFSGHSASSCQKIDGNNKDGQHANGIYTYAFDENCLTMYEVGDDVHFYGLDKNKKFHSMKWRTTIRLINLLDTDEVFKCEHCGMLLRKDSMCGCTSVKRSSMSVHKPTVEYGIMIDTFYPSATELPAAFEVIKSIADEVGIPILKSKRGHIGASGSTCKYKFTDDSVMFAGSYGEHHGISLVEDCNGCSYKTMQSACDSCRPVSKEICKKCKEFKIVSDVKTQKCKRCSVKEICTHTDCLGCPMAKCKKDGRVRAMYLDQEGGLSYLAVTKQKKLEAIGYFYITKGWKNA